MAGFKNGRITSDVHRELSAIIRELKDPRISNLLSIVKVDVSGDLSSAKVYVSAFGGTEDTIESVKGLKNAAGYIRRELGQRLKLRKTPELRFIADDSIVKSAQIADIIDNFQYNDSEEA